MTPSSRNSCEPKRLNPLYLVLQEALHHRLRTKENKALLETTNLDKEGNCAWNATKRQSQRHVSKHIIICSLQRDLEYRAYSNSLPFARLHQYIPTSPIFSGPRKSPNHPHPSPAEFVRSLSHLQHFFSIPRPQISTLGPRCMRCRPVPHTRNPPTSTSIHLADRAPATCTRAHKGRGDSGGGSHNT